MKGGYMKKVYYYVLSIFILAILGFLGSYYGFKDNSNLKKVRVAEVTHSVFYAPFYVSIHNG